VEESGLPVECCAQTAKGLSMLFKANGQQMAIATVLIKPGVPNVSYSVSSHYFTPTLIISLQ
jgi:hypothetical protein